MINVLLFTPFAITIFLGAFLLFQVQPIIGKYFLPWFGGVSSVWTIALVFFQIFLLLGYLYAFLITRLNLKIQAFIHILLLIFSSIILFSLFSKWSSPIMPGLDWKLKTATVPNIQVFLLLAVSIGFPFFVLSTTSTLLQKWFHNIWPSQSPYFLYSLSNTGSLLGLIVYPFLVEPLFNLKLQGNLWSILFLIYAILFIICSLFASNGKTIISEKQNFLDQKSSLPILLLSLVSSLMLVATSSQFTQSLSAVPFIWLIPLIIYLLTFILCFSGKKLFNKILYSYIFLLFSVLIMSSQLPPILLPFLVGIFFYSGFLFFGFMLIHTELYQLVPHPSKLNYYYLLIAIGSAIGGILAGIIAPIFISVYWEFFFCIIFTCLLAAKNLLEAENTRFYHYFIPKYFKSKNQVYFFFTATLLSLFIFMPIYYAKISGTTVLYTARNFYGALTVVSKKTKNGNLLELLNGKIVHGRQFENRKLRIQPVSYYSKSSGVGLTILNFPKKNIRLGAVGLGAGILASYGKDGDFFRFYEINPLVISVAKNYFTYTKDSKANIDIVLDDARLALEKEVLKATEEKYDIIAIDAFSDEAIPIHLLTKEAVDTYLKRLNNPDGVLAIHISNAYIDLVPVIIEFARHYKLEYIFINSKSDTLSDESQWMLLSYNKQFLEMDFFNKGKKKINSLGKKVNLWTDDYSNLFQILKFN